MGILLCLLLAQAAAAPKFVISGTVVDPSGEPLGKTLVLIITTLANRPVTSSMTTAEDGRFRFENVAAGKYTLAAERRGYPRQSLNEHQGFSTAVAAGPDIDSANIRFRLHADAGISGTVTDDQNDPVRNAQVMLFRMSNESGHPSMKRAGQAQTDDQGMYRARHLEPGKYLIAVQATPWYAQHQFGPAKSEALDMVFPLTFYGGSTDPASATPVTIAWGATPVANVILQAVPALRVNIRTSNAEAQPQQQTYYNVTVMNRVFGTELPMSVPASRTASGIVEVAGLPPGNHELKVQSFGANASVAEANIDPSRDTEFDISKNIRELIAVSGTFQLDSGKAAWSPNSFVNLREDGSEISFGAQISSTGQFEFQQKLPPGKYRVEIATQDELYIKSVEANGVRASGFLVDVGAEAMKLNLVASHGLGRVEGVALRDGKPEGGALVLLVPEVRRDTEFRRDQSDSDGTFTLGSVPPGNYTVIALDNWDAPWQDTEFLKRALLNGKAIRVTAGGKHNVRVEIQ